MKSRLSFAALWVLSLSFGAPGQAQVSWFHWDSVDYDVQNAARIIVAQQLNSIPPVNIASSNSGHFHQRCTTLTKSGFIQLVGESQLRSLDISKV